MRGNGVEGAGFRVRLSLGRLLAVVVELSRLRRRGNGIGHIIGRRLAAGRREDVESREGAATAQAGGRNTVAAGCCLFLLLLFLLLLFLLLLLLL